MNTRIGLTVREKEEITIKIMTNRAFCWICKIEYDYEDYDAVMEHHDKYFDKHRAFYRGEEK